MTDVVCTQSRPNEWKPQFVIISVPHAPRYPAWKDYERWHSYTTHHHVNQGQSVHSYTVLTWRLIRQNVLKQVYCVCGGYQILDQHMWYWKHVVNQWHCECFSLVLLSGIHKCNIQLSFSCHDKSKYMLWASSIA